MNKLVGLMIANFALLAASAETGGLASTEKEPTSVKPTVPPPAKKPDESKAEPSRKSSSESEAKEAVVSSLKPDELEDFATNPTSVQNLIRTALKLTERNLRYQFGSSDPSKGGMDCSGTIYHVLQGTDLKDVPRQSDEMYHWIAKSSVFHRTEGAQSLEDAKFAALRPGDLLFWTGTYEVKQRASGVSHVMLYLGKRARDGRPVMFGASDGRSYNGTRQSGVSVFDFNLPAKSGKAAFFGYGSLPFETKEEVKKGLPAESVTKKKAADKN